MRHVFAQNSTPEVREWIIKARQHLNDEPDSCLYYTDLIVAKAKSNRNYWALSKSFTYSGRVKEKRGQIEAAVIDYFEGLRWIARADTADDFNSGVLTRNIAGIQMDFKNYEEAQVYYDSALFFFNRHVREHPEIAKKDNDFRHIFSTRYFKVEGLRRLGDIESARDILIGLLKDKRTPKGTRINSLYQLGFIFNDMNEVDSAQSYFQKGIDHDGATPFYIARGLHNLGMVSFQQKKYGEAINRYKKAVAVKEKLSNKKSLFISLMDLGESFLLAGKLDSALHYFNHSIRVLDEVSLHADPDYYIIYLLMSKASGKDMSSSWKLQDQFISCNNEFLGTQQAIKDEARKRAFNLSLDQYRSDIKHKREFKLLDRKYAIWVIVIVILATVASVLGAKSLIMYWRKKRSKDLNQVLRPRHIRNN